MKRILLILGLLGVMALSIGAASVLADDGSDQASRSNDTSQCVSPTGDNDDDAGEPADDNGSESTDPSDDANDDGVSAADESTSGSDDIEGSDQGDNAQGDE